MVFFLFGKLPCGLLAKMGEHRVLLRHGEIGWGLTGGLGSGSSWGSSGQGFCPALGCNCSNLGGQGAHSVPRCVPELCWAPAWL